MSQGPRKDKNDLADQLAAFAAGQHGDDHGSGSGSGMDGHAHAQVDLTRPASAAKPPGPIPKSPPTPRPAEPELDAHAAELAREADAVAHVVEDDDTLNLPAPTPDMLAHRRAAPPAPRRAPIARTVGFKQTLIPILLTLGLLLPGLAFWSFALGEESPISATPGIAIALIATGVIMLIFALITMLQVKHQLDQAK
jgi:hypothetical protein